MGKAVEPVGEVEVAFLGVMNYVLARSVAVERAGCVGWNVAGDGEWFRSDDIVFDVKLKWC